MYIYMLWYWTPTLLTWMQNFLCLRMAGTEGAVEFEVIHIVQECTTHREEHVLQWYSSISIYTNDSSSEQIPWSKILQKLWVTHYCIRYAELEIWHNVKFDVLTVMMRKDWGFWDVMPQLLVKSYWCFRAASWQKTNALSCSKTKQTLYQPTGNNCPEVLNLK